MKKLDESIDIPSEIKAVADFVRETWDDIPEDFAWVVANIQRLAFRDATNWVSNHSCTPIIKEALERRSEQLKKHPDGQWTEELQMFDVPYRGMFYLLLYSDELYAENKRGTAETEIQDSEGKTEVWDYEKKAKTAYRLALSLSAQLTNALPKGWAAARAEYQDFDGMEEYDAQADAAKFKGYDTAGASTPSLPSRIALPYIMYDQVCQDRNPGYMLVSSIYGHFLGVVEHINTIQLKDSVSRLLHREYPIPMDSGRLHSNHPFVEAALKKGGELTSEDYENARAKAREDAINLKPPMTPEEKRQWAKQLIQDVVAEIRAEEQPRSADRPKG